MKIERFQELAEAFGGDLSRWPEAERKNAGALLRGSPEARRIVELELALDAAFDRAAVEVDDDRADRVAAAVAARIDATTALRPPIATPTKSAPRPLWSAGFLVAMGLLGVVSGALSPATAERNAGTATAQRAATPTATIVDVADAAGYYSTRFLVSWDQ